MKDILRVDQLGYRIDNTPILQNINLGLQKGQFALITGPSGCGKSTLLKIIASLITPTSGSVIFEGQDIKNISPETYRQQVSYCAQTPALFGDTVYDNLAFPWQIRRQNPDETKLIDDLSRFSLPAETLKKAINELSGGEKQRVSLIRNLQFLPKILLLDEITSALDETNKQQVNEIIHQMVAQENISVLWVTHDENEIRHADDVIRLPAHSAEIKEAEHERA
ncbi:iron ABC transporter ATP-binding protein FetA [Pluralibacter gergoviae]